MNRKSQVRSRSKTQQRWQLISADQIDAIHRAKHSPPDTGVIFPNDKPMVREALMLTTYPLAHRIPRACAKNALCATGGEG